MCVLGPSWGHLGPFPGGQGRDLRSPPGIESGKKLRENVCFGLLGGILDNLGGILRILRQLGIILADLVPSWAVLVPFWAVSGRAGWWF